MSLEVPVNTVTSELSPELQHELDRTAELLSGRRFAILTGAGVSTDSGIPDYRGEGAPKRTPMTFQQFLADDRYRKRYWAGSHLGYRRFAAAHPNDGHRAIARLELAGAANGVITQNVDGLHKQAGSQKVVDLHGAMDRVLCLVCGQIFAREAITARIDAANPWLDTEGAVEIAPDGDAIVTDIDAFLVPDCTVCGGHLKPDVVFFGEFIPAEKYREASALVRSADALVIAGSSLVVNSGIRLLEEARRRRLPIVIVNRGATRGDDLATHRVEAGCSDFLAELVGATAVA